MLRNSRVLSLHQPWASLLVWGLKTIETRSWGTPWRGPLLIHAGKALPPEYIKLYLDPHFAKAFEVMGELRDLPRGCVVGMATLESVVPAMNVKDKIGNAERAFGLYGPMRQAWCMEFDSARRFTTPVPARGYQGLFRPDIWDESTQAALADEVRKAGGGG
ncbi:MAG: ASCH domain-containing protein [Planctomycetes bacterium]|nr:ASCH domain-containing protein [Planctomycetota bacterium]